MVDISYLMILYSQMTCMAWRASNGNWQQHGRYF